MPGMPGIEDFPTDGNMGLALMSCTTRSGPIRGWVIRGVGSGRRRKIQPISAVFSAGLDWAGCSLITVARPLEAIFEI